MSFVLPKPGPSPLSHRPAHKPDPGKLGLALRHCNWCDAVRDSDDLGYAKTDNNGWHFVYRFNCCPTCHQQEFLDVP